MIASLSFSQVGRELKGRIVPTASCSGVSDDVLVNSLCTDSRQVKRGDVYLALKGERFDGHQFVMESVAKGASAVVVSEEFESLAVPQLVVLDTCVALGGIAALNRDKFSGELFGITGSSGKTTVKDMLAEILSVSHSVLATAGNFNNHIGVPLTLLRLDSTHQYAVIEMGANSQGEIAYLCRLAKPTVTVVNNVMAAHLEGFGTLDDVARAKGEIYEGLHPQGIALINADEPYAEQWKARVNSDKFCTFSTASTNADFFVSALQADSMNCMSFDLHTPSGVIPIRLGVMGQHNVANALAASACAFSAGVSLEDIASGLQSFGGVSGRMEVLNGLQNSTVIDDSYNANPGSMKAAVDVLAAKNGKTVLVIGDMAELGECAAKQHEEVGRYAKNRGIGHLLGVGDLSMHAVKAFGPGAEGFNQQSDLLDSLEALLDRDTVVLVKGSRSANMDALVRRISISGDE